MSPKEELFKMFDELVASRPLSVERVSRITGHRFQEGNSNEYFSFYVSKDEAHPLVRAIELRVPKHLSAAPDGILSLDVAHGLCIREQDVLARYGDHPKRPGPPRPELRDAPRPIVYDVPWGKLGFSFERTGRECLVDLGFNAVKA